MVIELVPGLRNGEMIYVLGEVVGVDPRADVVIDMLARVLVDEEIIVMAVAASAVPVSYSVDVLANELFDVLNSVLFIIWINN